MKKEISIAHLTDIHIGPSEVPVRAINVRRNFEKALLQITFEKPDLIVLGGDLAADCGEVEAYQWIKPRLDQADIPYLIIPGNHDRVDNLIRIFDLKVESKETALYYARRLNGLKLIFLDSSTRTLSRTQLEWLEQEAGESEEAALLFIHHPPLFCNCVFMDSKYPLLNREESFALIRRLPMIQHIFCGHYHVEKTIRDSEKNIYLTPSTMMQLHPDSPEFEVSGISPGWRFIRWNGSRLETRVRYLSLE